MSADRPARSSPAQAIFDEQEAAQALGLTVERFRALVRTHIVTDEADATNLQEAVYQASDLVVLRLLAGLPRGRTA